jgi:hypothetical protein
MGLIAISGIFYPITALPLWLQWIAQNFPMYWLGLGMRSALLPASAVSVEIGQSWQHLETIGVFGACAVLGLVLAPIVPARMARRETGSNVAERREKPCSGSCNVIADPVTDPLLTPMSYGFASAAVGLDAAMREPHQD